MTKSDRRGESIRLSSYRPTSPSELARRCNDNAPRRSSIHYDERRAARKRRDCAAPPLIEPVDAGQSMNTVVPTRTRLKSSLTSLIDMRMQPCDAASPRERTSSVP